MKSKTINFIPDGPIIDDVSQPEETIIHGVFPGVPFN